MEKCQLKYKTEEDANTALRTLSKLRPSKYKTKGVYKCFTCEGWHITRLSERKHKLRSDRFTKKLDDKYNREIKE